MNIFLRNSLFFEILSLYLPKEPRIYDLRAVRCRRHNGANGGGALLVSGCALGSWQIDSRSLKRRNN